VSQDSKMMISQNSILTNKTSHLQPKPKISNLKSLKKGTTATASTINFGKPSVSVSHSGVNDNIVSTLKTGRPSAKPPLNTKIDPKKLNPTSNINKT